MEWCKAPKYYFLASALLFIQTLFLSVPVLSQEAGSTGPDKGELFKLAFGYEQPDIYYPYTVVLIVGGVRIADIDIEVNPVTGEMKVPADFLTPALFADMRFSDQIPLDTYVDEEGVQVERMRQDGFAIQLDLRRLSLTADLPVWARRRVPLSVSRVSNAYDDRLMQAQAPVSGYMNVYNYHRYRNDAKGKDHTQVVRTESNLTAGNWIFQHEGNYIDDSNEGEFYFNAGARVIYAQRSTASHFIFGDQRPRNSSWELRPAPIARMFNEPIVGVGVNKRADLSAFANISNTFFYDFDLDSNAEIQVFINGDLYYQQSLVEGAYRLQDLALDQGLNRIRIVLIKENGDVDEFSDTYYQSYELLNTGESELQFSAGYTYNQEALRDITNLNKDDPTTILYYRFGLSEKYTLGSYLQFQNDRHIVGGMVQVGIGLGLLNLDLAYSEDVIAGSDTAFRAELIGNPVYSPFGFFDESYQSYGLILEYFGENFTNGSSIISPIKWNISPVIELGLTANSRLTARINHLSFYDGRKDATSYSFSYIQRWRQMDVELIYEELTLFNDQEESQVRMVFTWNGDNGRKYVRAEQNFNNTRTDVTATYRPEYNTKMSYGVSSYYEDSDNYSNKIDMTYQNAYTNNAVEFNSFKNNGQLTDILSGRLEGSRGALRAFANNSPDRKDYRVGVEGAIAFVGSTFALSKVIDDSFAIVAPNPGIKGSNITLNPGGRIDWLGPAVISSLKGYQSQRISIKESDAPFGVDFGSRSFYTDTGYGGGLLVAIGSEGNILLSATLVDAEGESIPLATGRLSLQNSENTIQPVLFFTNRQGLFSVTGLIGGTYLLQIDNGLYEPFEVTISFEQSDRGYINLEELVLTLSAGSL